MITSYLGSMSQPVRSLVLPNQASGSVKLDISAIKDVPDTEITYEYLAVFVKNESGEYHSNPIQGTYRTAAGLLIFTPYLPFENGLTYVVRIQNQYTESGYRYQDFQIGEKPRVDQAKLLAIYPSADELPENLLRFYFYFRTPMKKDQALQHIHLVDAEGNVDPRAFMEFKQELWSADAKRLTLLFDPGRIKRGVSTNEELGPALIEGNTYSLRISGSWQDVHGQQLLRAETKEFAVGPAYRQQIEVKDWVIHKPQANSKDALSIQFDRIMDHALVQSMLQVKDENDRIITGNWEISDDEKNAQFTPTEQWKTGEYQIIFDGRMEDVAGNNLEGLLDQKTDRTDYNSPILVRHFSI